MDQQAAFDVIYQELLHRHLSAMRVKQDDRRQRLFNLVEEMRHEFAAYAEEYERSR